MATSQDQGSESQVVVAQDEVRRFIIDALRIKEAPEDQARVMADVLVAADYRGHFSHGLNRLSVYVAALRFGTTSVTATPKVVAERAGTAVVDGGKLFGPVVGLFALQMAIKKAREAGVGWVAVRNSNHFGIAGWYSMKAAAEGMIGISMTTTSPAVYPPRSAKAFLGTDPISVAAPGTSSADDFVFDGAMSTVALGKVEMCSREEREVPPGWGVDRHGKPCTDPKEIIEHGGLTTLGGAEESGGYKGSGMAQVVEIFCGLLSGGLTSDRMGEWADKENVLPTSHCFIAIDPSAFVPNFADSLSDFVRRLRSLDTIDGRPILAPGDPERQHMAKCDRLGGIPYHVNLVAEMNRLANSYGIEAMKTLT